MLQIVRKYIDRPFPLREVWADVRYYFMEWWHAYGHCKQCRAGYCRCFCRGCYS